MNKFAIAASIALAIGAALPAAAQNGTINFEGSVTATTCSITWPGGGTGTDTTITLPTVPVSALATAGDNAGRQPIRLTIGGTDAQCTSGSAALELNPARTANQTNGYLNNTATATPATNVQIALRDGNDAPIDIALPWRSEEIDLSTTRDIEFSAEYRASGAATAGNVAADVGYTMDYR